MKVFQVTTERCEDYNKEILIEVQYVTHKEDTIQAVTEYFTERCEQYGEDLKGVREVLVILQHIIPEAKT